MDSPASVTLEEIVLARLLTAKDGSDTASKIAKDLAPLAAHRWRGTAWTETLERALNDLEADGALERGGRGRVGLTPAGRQRARAFLGLAESHKALRWTAVRDGQLVARALGMQGSPTEAARRISKGDGLRAELLAQRFGVALDGTPTLAQVQAAIGWKLLERGADPQLVARVPRKTSFDKTVVLGALVSSRLGLSSARDGRTAFSIATAQAAGSPKDDVRKLREALLQRLLDPAPPVPQASPTPEQLMPSLDERRALSVPPPARPVLDLTSFAEMALEAARRSDTGRFGEDRVLISHAWRQFQRDHPHGGLDEAGFKQRLLEANRERFLSLVCADMAPLLDQTDVAASEIRYLSATFHFVCL
jgi:hypothetical protein